MSIEDSLIRRQIFIQRYSGGLSRKARLELLKMVRLINARIMRSSDDIFYGRSNLIRQSILNIINSGLEDISELLITSINRFAGDELSFIQRSVQEGTDVVLSLPAIGQIQQAIMMEGITANVGASSISLAEAISSYGAKKRVEIVRLLNDGILEGKTTKEITRDISLLAKGRASNQIEALVRTATNHASSVVTNQFAKENSDVLEGEKWTATLDSRTTLLCAGRDGTIYPVGKGPKPPAHWNCRSRRVPVVKPEFASQSQTAMRPQKGDTTGRISNKTNFDSWLRKQSKEFQDEYLGKEKAKLFRKGLKIDRFRDETGKNFTLEELRQLEPVTFAGGGIPNI